MRSSGASEAASLQMASFRSWAVRPERISSRNAALISASCGSLESVSRERDLARMARGTNGSQRFSVQLHVQHARILGGHLEMVRGREEVIFAGLHRSVKDHIFVGHDRDLGSLARLDLQFHQVVRRRNRR